MTNLAALLDQTTATYPERVAIVFGDTRLTYAQVNASANQVANLLVSRGVEPGDKVALSCPNLPYFSIIYFGILKAGATVVPLNVLLKPREVAFHLDDSDAKVVFAYEGTAELPIGEAVWEGFNATEGTKDFFIITADPSGDSPVEAAETFGASVATLPPTFDTVQVHDDDTAVILYTSGTTGQPKGAELRHRNMRDNALAGSGLFEADEMNPDIYLCVLPLFHSFGQTVIQNSAVAFGGTLVMLPRFEASAALELILKERVTFFAGVPTMYWGLLGALDESVDVKTIAANLRVAAAGGSALPGEIHRQFTDRFGVTILEGYGLSETSPVASFAVFGERPRVGSIGKPIRDGWFRSGDLARKDEDGFYFIVDRSKDMIIRGGFNVYPRELEERLMTHPAVSLVAVIGVPHDQHGQEIKAVVVKNEDFGEVSEADLVAWGKEQFAAYKYPRSVQFRDDLPMTSTGKILKRALSSQPSISPAAV